MHLGRITTGLSRFRVSHVVSHCDRMSEIGVVCVWLELFFVQFSWERAGLKCELCCRKLCWGRICQSTCPRGGMPSRGRRPTRWRRSIGCGTVPTRIPCLAPMVSSQLFIACLKPCLEWIGMWSCMESIYSLRKYNNNNKWLLVSLN